MSSTESAVPVAFGHDIPGKPLRDFVDLFRYYAGHEVEYSRERILPMAVAELVIDLGSGYSGAGISGPHSEAFIIERTQLDELIGIHFKFGGAFPFLDCPFS